MMLAFVSPVAAQQPEPQRKVSQADIDAAREIIVLRGVAGIFDAAMAGVVEQSKNTLLLQNPMLQKDLNEISAQLRKDLAPRVTDVTGDAAKIFAGYFTEQDLKDLLAFYRSPLGKKVATTEERALTASLSAGQEWVRKLSEEVTATMRAELKKRGHDL
ncbi:MAG: DUF2059 domain-containing protein [Pseudolabrys sp.]|nr:DUF2059 domain-containing protein [Pseudolabrys sp.]